MDILASLVLEVRCPSCGQHYEVPVANVLASHGMMNEGCAARGESECPPLYLASLLPEQDLRELEAVVGRLAAYAASHGATLHLATHERK